MEIPTRFLRVSPSRRGVKSQEGWLEIEVKAVDLEGVSKLYINLDEVAKLKHKSDEATTLLEAWEATFGAKNDEPPKSD